MKSSPMKPLPEIKIVRAICLAYGQCYHAAGLYYGGHYRTKEAAAIAAAKRKRALEEQVARRGHKRDAR